MAHLQDRRGLFRGRGQLETHSLPPEVGGELERARRQERRTAPRRFDLNNDGENEFGCSSHEKESAVAQ